MHEVFSFERMKPVGRLINSRQFFYLSTIIFLLAKLALLAIPLTQRMAPIEPDDAYAYIQRAAQIEYCTLGDCRALQDIQAQLEVQSSDPTNAYHGGHLWHRTFPNIYPLYSFLLFIGHKSGLSWEAAYSAVSGLGILLLSIAAAILLRELFGDLAAGLSLILLSTYIFQSDMLHAGSPHAWAMAASLFAWVLILRRDKLRNILVPSLFAISILLHPVGTLFVFLSTGLVALLDHKNKSNRGIFLWGAILAVSALAIPAIFPGNSLASGVQIGARPNSLFDFQNLLDNLGVANVVLSTWVKSFWNGWVVAFLSLAGYTLLESHQRKRFGSLWALLGSLLVASILGSFVSRGFPSDLFARLLVPFGILTTGLVATVIVDLFKQIPSLFDRSINKRRTVRLIASGFLAFLAIFSNVKYDLRHYPLTLQTRIDRGNILLDASQPAALNSLRGEAVIFGDEVILHYYFLNGGLTHRAAYYPILAGTEDELPWLSSDREPIFFAAKNPISRSNFSSQGGLRIMQEPTLRISTETGFPNEIQLLLQTGGSQSTLTATQVSIEGVALGETAYELQAEFSGWITVDEVDPGSETITLSNSGPEPHIALLGVRQDPGSSLNWPWDSGISIQFSEENQVISFKTDELFPHLSGHIQVLLDKGDYFLARLFK